MSFSSSAPDPLLFREELGFTIDPAEEGTRLDTYLARRMRWRSRTSIQKLVQEGLISITRQGERRVVKKSSSVLIAADEIAVTLPRPKRDIDFGEAGPPSDPNLPILYEDRWLVAVDKPPNVPVHPAGRNLYRTVITTLHRRYRRPDDPTHDIVPKLCHRIDLETSGVLLVAKDDRAHRDVQRLFRDRATEKEYLAVVHGIPEPREGFIEKPLGPALGMKVAMASGVRWDVGLEAKTEYRVESVHGDFSILRIRLHTGRHHQIRVHFSSIRHPLVGDKIYGGDEELFLKYYDDALTAEDHDRLLLPRQALHSTRLALDHPITGERLVIESPLPEDLREFLDRQ